MASRKSAEATRENKDLITNARLVNYIHSLEPDQSEILEAVRKEALAADVPIIRDETAALLKCLIRIIKPGRILEIGAAVGYSALIMAEVMPVGSTILTVESYEPRIREARRNFMHSPYQDRITLVDGDAGELLRRLTEEKQNFDFIFLDAAKAQYPLWFPYLMRLMQPGAVLVSDNILQEGSIIESRYQIARRDRTIHARMREYLYTLKHTDGLETAIVPIGDGISISTRYQEDQDESS